MSIRFDDRVVIVTGAGNGLGRSHALAFAQRGAKVVVNDFGGARDGTGGSSETAQAVVAEIEAAGGEALADGGDVTDEAAMRAMAEAAVARWGRIDVLVNNAGILRDRSFAKMTREEWDAVVAVHLTGTATATMAVWGAMRDGNYGRIVNTTSTSGIYGNFGQANYGAAKAGAVGLMNVLSIEGAKYDIRVNCIAPTAATRMTEDIMPPDMLNALEPRWVTPAVLLLASADAPRRTIMLAGGGGYAVARLMESEGLFLSEAERTPETLAARFDELSDMSGAQEMTDGGQHVAKLVKMAS